MAYRRPYNALNQFLNLTTLVVITAKAVELCLQIELVTLLCAVFFFEEYSKNSFRVQFNDQYSSVSNSKRAEFIYSRH